MYSHLNLLTYLLNADNTNPEAKASYSDFDI